tara:strand:- start:48 stop:263 length:216 start_codon:yes stop_codon:yes gene_type:complete
LARLRRLGAKKDSCSGNATQNTVPRTTYKIFGLADEARKSIVITRLLLLLLKIAGREGRRTVNWWLERTAE